LARGRVQKDGRRLATKVTVASHAGVAFEIKNVVVMQFGLSARPVEREIPSLRLKNGFAQDDT
jgi:hypothetical protein